MRFGMRSGRMVSLAAVAVLTMWSVPAFAACAFGCGAASQAFAYGTQYLWPGQTVTWETSTYLEKGAAGPDEGPFYAYLVEPNRRASRVPRVDGGVQLAQVETSTRRDPSFFDASVTFTLPAATPRGSYAVEVCDDPCTARLGYLGATRVEVVSGDMEAHLNERIDVLAQKMRSQRFSLSAGAARGDKRVRRTLRAEVALIEERLDARMEDLAASMTELERQLAAERQPEEQDDISQSALAGGVVVLVLFGWLFRERARNRQSLEQ